ncbi:uncharacterized protein LOC144133789 [Amblyomma americanum]
MNPDVVDGNNTATAAAPRAQVPAHRPAAEDIASVHGQLPSFWPRSPAVWFAQVVAVFDLWRITSQSVKYLHVVSTLSSKVNDKFHDVLKTPDPSSMYDHFKSTVLVRKTISERSGLQQLLSTENLGDRRPSHLLHRMPQLLVDRPQGVNSPILRELFFQCLPQSLVVVLAAAGDVSFDKLAELANRVSYYSGLRSVAAIPSAVPSTHVFRQ